MWRHCNEEIKDTVNVMHGFVHVVPIVYQTEEHKNMLLSVDTSPLK